MKRLNLWLLAALLCVGGGLLIYLIFWIAVPEKKDF